MAWQDITIPMLRILINDIGATPTYDDDILEQLILVSALLVKQDISFDTTYNIDIIAHTILPDPSSDTIFMNFIVMKAACQADFNTFRTKALMEGVSAKLGPAALTIAGNSSAFKTLLSLGPCATYDKMRLDYLYGTGQLCKAILSPFIGNNFDPDSLSTSYDNNTERYRY